MPYSVFFVATFQFDSASLLKRIYSLSDIFIICLTIWCSKNKTIIFNVINKIRNSIMKKLFGRTVKLFFDFVGSYTYDLYKIQFHVPDKCLCLTIIQPILKILINILDELFLVSRRKWWVKIVELFIESRIWRPRWLEITLNLSNKNEPAAIFLCKFWRFLNNLLNWNSWYYNFF